MNATPLTKSAEVAQRLASLWTPTGQSVQEPAAQRERWLSFELAGQSYALDVLEVQEVLRLPDITPTAGAANYVLGVINLRGSIVTVMDLRLRLGFAHVSPSATSRIIVLDLKPHALGLAVDRVGEVLQVPLARIEPPPEVGVSATARPVRGIFVRDSEVVMRLDTVCLLNSESAPLNFSPEQPIKGPEPIAGASQHV